MDSIPRSDITGLVLAGGLGSRMGGVDKGLQPFHGVPLALHSLQRLQRQTGTAALNANRNLATYAAFGVPVWPDASDGFDGNLGFISRRKSVVVFADGFNPETQHVMARGNIASESHGIVGRDGALGVFKHACAVEPHACFGHTVVTPSVESKTHHDFGRKQLARHGSCTRARRKQFVAQCQILLAQLVDGRHGSIALHVGCRRRGCRACVGRSRCCHHGRSRRHVGSYRRFGIIRRRRRSARPAPVGRTPGPARCPTRGPVARDEGDRRGRPGDGADDRNAG